MVSRNKAYTSGIKPNKSLPKIRASSLVVGDIVLDPADGMPLMVVTILLDCVIAFNAMAHWAIPINHIVYFYSNKKEDQLLFLDNTEEAAKDALDNSETVRVTLNL